MKTKTTTPKTATKLRRSACVRLMAAMLAVLSTLTTSATEYITDVMVIGGTKSDKNLAISKYTPQGWRYIDYDLNKGCGSSSDYIYLFYKAETNAAGDNLDYITDFYISDNSSASTLTYDGRTYHLAAFDGGERFKELKGDLNSNAGGTYIRLYYTKELFPDHRIVTGISFDDNSTNAVPWNGTGAAADLNKGCGSQTPYIYMHFTTEKTTDPGNNDDDDNGDGDDTPHVRRDIHVSPSGNDDSPGTEAAPLLTIQKALDLVQPGDRILLHEGTYYITERLKIPALSTSEDARCEMRAWPDDAVGKVIIDGNKMSHNTETGFNMGRCIYVDHNANYWTFYGLTLQNAEDNGMKIEGSYNIVERCTFRWNNDTGLQIGMFTDFTNQETQSFPISGSPKCNPGFSYCRYNTVINCEAYENYDSRTYNGNDDGADADGFACKIFPGPGNQFLGCRAWVNSNDNWDLSMGYYPVVIDQCWAYRAGYNKVNKKFTDGDGFRLGGGITEGDAPLDQSVGAHVIKNCVAFDNLRKGFDQGQAYEGMYLINCTAWGNDRNYSFTSPFKYGMVNIINCAGWGATAVDEKGNPIGNHEFVKPGEEGYQNPANYTTFNSWMLIDGCLAIGENYKPDGYYFSSSTQNHSGDFMSLSVADFLAPREEDGSLPNNNFARLKPNNTFKDQGKKIINFSPARHMTIEQCAEAGLEYITAAPITIPYNDNAPDLGAYETDGVASEENISDYITLTCATANAMQEVLLGDPIANITYKWNTVGTQAKVEGLAEGLTYSTSDQSLTISGTPQAGCTFRVTISGNASAGVKPVVMSGTIKVIDLTAISPIGAQPSRQAHKFLRRGQLLIQKDGHTYNAMGLEVTNP